MYPLLFGVINAAVTPDLRGVFLRGIDLTGTVDPDGAGRTTIDVVPQGHAYETHAHIAAGDGVAEGTTTAGGFGLIRSHVSGTGDFTTSGGAALDDGPN